MEKKKIVAFIVIMGLFFTGGYLIGSDILFRAPENPNPIIDGSWNENEYWQTSNWIFSEYIIPDENHIEANNYYYIELTDNYLYILADLVSDVTEENDPNEWFSFWIDTDNSTTHFSSYSWNDNVEEILSGGSENDGAMMFCYIPNTNSFNDTLWVYSQRASGWLLFNTTLNSTNSQVKHGFQTTINGNLEHRIFEIRVQTSSLVNFTATDFNIGFLGYGTMTLYTTLANDFWSAPTYMGYEIAANGILDEKSYFKCGTNIATN